jgi:hypothetical protein
VHYCGCGIGLTSCGIDRKDPSLDYTPGNTVAACTSCNKAKLTHSYETWKAIADAFVEKHGRGKMWPTDTHPDIMSDARRARAEQAKTGRGISLGIQALALWAVRVSNPYDKSTTFKKSGTMTGKRSRGRPRIRPVPAPRVDVRAAIEAERRDERILRAPGGFVWRGRWRPHS